MSTPAEPLARPGFLDRSRSIAPPAYNRWLIPPAALAVHLCIGEVYAFSVFKKPLTQLIGGTDQVPGNWTQSEVAWVFSVAIVVLGLSAAVFGGWLERAGPRKAMLAAAACFGGGFLTASVGVLLHQFWLVVFGYGAVGGVGLGVGYISPVSTLIKWFPDKPGLASGLAIMGFGGGAMIGSPLSKLLMDLFRSVTPEGVAGAFATLGVVYFAAMAFGALAVRLPPPGWSPGGASATPAGTVPASASATPAQAVRTPHFWLLWAVLLLNVSAGIGILEQASPMIREVFATRGEGGTAVERVTEAAATGFVGLLSLFNMAGRFVWSSLSDRIGRPFTYAIFFLLGAGLYALLPTLGQGGNVPPFVLACGVILSMYGGGFATIPAYLKDRFGVGHVGAIHGRLLTAWSVAGVLGPVLVNSLRDSQIARKAQGIDVYTPTMYLMGGLLAVGFVCNLLVRLLPARPFTPEPPRTP